MNKTITLLCTLLLAAPLAHAQQAYPNKPIRWIVPSSAGGGNDYVARLFGAKITENWGQQVLVDLRPGAAGILGSELLVNSPPDGHTILIVATGYGLNPSLYSKLPYDTINDFARVNLLAFSPNVLVVHPSLPVKSTKELIAFAKARPGELFFSSSGQGSAQHLSMELFMQMTGLKMTHVPYKGTAPSITDVVGGRIALTVASVISTRPMFTTGKLRALAVVGPKRTPALPEYPTVAESGVPGFGVENWYALFLPGGTNREIAVKIQQAVTRMLTDPAASKLLLGQGLDAVGNSQDEFTRLYAGEIAKWAKVVKAVGLQAN
jgi:tripartite-type tricarboxylate transporter receptor subunit TctC